MRPCHRAVGPLLAAIAEAITRTHPCPTHRRCRSCQGEVLLLQRAGKHNHGAWGLPGGNADPEDEGDLLVTARREAEEELGGAPPYTLLDTILTRRGDRLQKHYTVFVAGVAPEARAAWQPRLNEEHSAWRWVPVGQLGPLELHPVVKRLLKPEARQRTLAAVGRS